MKKLIVLLLVSLMATAAFGQPIDPDPDMVGFYFDMGATNNCLQAGAYTPGVPFDAYVVVTNPSVPVLGFEGTLTMTSSVAYGLLKLSVAPPAGGVSVGSGDEIITAFASVPQFGPANVVASVSVLVNNPAAVGEFFLSGIAAPLIDNGYPAYATGSGVDLTPVSLGVSTGGTDVPVATINSGNCVVAEDAVSFGSVKGLFR